VLHITTAHQDGKARMMTQFHLEVSIHASCMFLSAQAPDLTLLFYILWPYHSHVNETSDENAGLIGPIIITREDMGNPGGSPKDVN
jgi:hypothetical protein